MLSLAYETWFGILFGFFMCIVLFELVKKGYFRWVGRARPSHEIIQACMRQCGDWAVQCQQDKSDIIALTHANYAKAYCDALLQMANEEYIYECTGQEITSLKANIDKLQSVRIQRISESNPDLMPPKSLFTPASNYSTNV